MMDKNDKYREEFESYPPYQVRYRKTIKYHISHEKFVVPWQMVDKKEPEKVR